MTSLKIWAQTVYSLLFTEQGQKWQEDGQTDKQCLLDDEKHETARKKKNAYTEMDLRFLKSSTAFLMASSASTEHTRLG